MVSREYMKETGWMTIERVMGMKSTVMETNTKEGLSKTKLMEEECMHGNLETSMKGNGLWEREVVKVLGRI
jgi:hypothetical protein